MADRWKYPDSVIQIVGDVALITIHNSDEILVCGSSDAEKFRGVTVRDNGKGYAVCHLNGKDCFVHDIVMGKQKAPFVIDHINRNKLDNRRSNLRITTKQGNAYNQRLSKNSTSGYNGVCYRKDRNRWFAHITINGKYKYLGSARTPEEAYAIRLRAEEKYIKPIFEQERKQ